jgi:hypothetical protein
MIIRERKSGIDTRSEVGKQVVGKRRSATDRRSGEAAPTKLSSMRFLVLANLDDHTLAVAIETAKEAFAKAVEWHVVERFINVTIRDGVKNYTIAEFSSVMALLEITNTVEADGALEPKAKPNS